MQVLSGLQNSAISRLKLTWAEVGGRRRRVLETCGALMASDKSFATLRDTLASVDPPCLPFFGMYVRWCGCLWCMHVRAVVWLSVVHACTGGDVVVCGACRCARAMVRVYKHAPIPQDIYECRHAKSVIE